MQLTHSRYDNFFTLLIMINRKCGILSLEPDECLKKIIKVLHVFILNSKGHNRVGHMHFCHLKIDADITECLTRSTVHTEESKDVAGTSLGDVHHLCRVHSYHPADLYLFLCVCVQQYLPFLNLTLINPNISNLPKLCLLKLKRKPDKWLLLINNHLLLFAVFVKIICIIVDLRGPWKVINYTIHHSLNSLIFISTTHKHRTKIQS